MADEYIQALKARARLRFPSGQPDVLICGIDPSGGGDGSDFTIVTITIKDGHQVVVSSQEPHTAQRSAP